MNNQPAENEITSFKFPCPHCGQRLEAEIEWVGMQAECENCKEEITIPPATPDLDNSSGRDNNIVVPLDSDKETGEKTRKSGQQTAPSVSQLNTRSDQAPQLSASRIARLCAIIKAPAWKFWISRQAKCKAINDIAVSSDPAIADFLIPLADDPNPVGAAVISALAVMVEYGSQGAVDFLVARLQDSDKIQCIEQKTLLKIAKTGVAGDIVATELLRRLSEFKPYNSEFEELIKSLPVLGNCIGDAIKIIVQGICVNADPDGKGFMGPCPDLYISSNRFSFIKSLKKCGAATMSQACTLMGESLIQRAVEPSASFKLVSTISEVINELLEGGASLPDKLQGQLKTTLKPIVENKRLPDNLVEKKARDGMAMIAQTGFPRISLTDAQKAVSLGYTMLLSPLARLLEHCEKNEQKTVETSLVAETPPTPHEQNSIARPEPKTQYEEWQPPIPLITNPRASAESSLAERLEIESHQPADSGYARPSSQQGNEAPRLHPHAKRKKWQKAIILLAIAAIISGIARWFAVAKVTDPIVIGVENATICADRGTKDELAESKAGTKVKVIESREEIVNIPTKLSGENAPELKPCRALPGKGMATNQAGKLSVYDVSLNISLALRPEADIAACRKEFEQIVGDLRQRLQGKRQPGEIVQTFNDYLFKEKMFRYESKVHFLGEVLDQKCGSCVGLTTLYVTLAQRLGVPCVAVNLPRHVFARYRNETSSINIEMGANGATVADDWFVNEYALDTAIIEKGVYLRELTEKELVAIVLSNYGNVLRETGALLESKKYLDQSLSLSPRSVDALYSRGITLIETGHIDDGIKDCDAALALDPGCAYAYVNRGKGHSLKGELPKALADFNKAITLNPKQAAFYNNRGSIYSAMGLADKSLNDYNKAIGIDPALAEVYCNRANLFRDRGDLSKALQDYDRALRISPGFAIAHFNRGIACMKTGMMDAAAAAFSNAIKHNPRLGEAYYNRGMVLAMTGRCSAALEDCDKAIALLPESGGAYLIRAIVHAMVKDKKRALADIRKAFALDPNLRAVSERNEAFRDWWNDPEYKRIFQ